MICQGYRDTDLLRIRDQTHSVWQKTVKHKATTNFSPTIAVSLQDRAKAAFFANYVFEGSKSYDFLQPFYMSASSDKILSASLEAASLAFFAHQENASPAAKEGIARYTEAIALVQQAISCPISARKDTTLLATMILDLYEKLTNFKPEFRESWKSHVEGSLALVGLRDTQLSRGHKAYRMLVRLSTNLLISCVATDTPLPKNLVALRKYASNNLDTKDPKWLLSDLMLKYMNFREAISKGQLTDRDTIASLLSLDAEFLNNAVIAPIEWQCRTIWIPFPTERVLGDHLDTFLDHHITQMHNVGRLVRILLNELLLEYSSTPAGVGWSYQSHGPSLRTQAEKTIGELVNEICASVPQYTCPELLKNQSGSLLLHVSTPCKTKDRPSSKGIRIYTAAQKVRAYTLIFPLFVAGQSVTAGKLKKLWIIDQLHFMASAMGIRNAEVVARLLEAGLRLNPWKVYALLGSYAFAA